MKPIGRIIAVILFPFVALAQPYGNEWIEYNQEYYHFPISADGVYRIDRTTLTSAGINVGSIDPRRFQVFARGQEIPIYVEGEGDGSFDSGDFIEFFGERNDGWADESMYGSGETHSQPHYSLINDTIHYFLTWNNSTSNSRYQNENDTSYSSYTAADYLWKESLIYFTSNYYPGEPKTGGGTEPAYESCEGWFDLSFSLGGGRTRSISTSRTYRTGPGAELTIRAAGLSNYDQLNRDHHLRVEFAGTTFDTIFEGYNLVTRKLQVNPTNFNSNNTSVTFRSINDLGSTVDRMTIVYASLKYPHEPNFNNSSLFRGIVPNQSGQSKTYLNFSGFNVSGNAWCLDLDNNKRIRITSSGGTSRILIPNASGEKDCFFYSDGLTNSVTSISAVNGNARFVNYSNLETNNAFVIVTHKKLSMEANRYASYRSSTGNPSVVAFMSDLSMQFAFGIHKHPKAIRGFVDFISDNWSSAPSHLLLLGKSVKSREHRKSAVNFEANLVPSWGNPASDVLLTAGLNNKVMEPMIPTGRISANTNEEVSLYLDKVIEYESQSVQPWMKNILHFAGGTSASEANLFEGYLKIYENILTDTSFGGRVYTFKKSTSSPIQISLSDSIKTLINQGASIMTFFGHASTTGGFDQNIDDPSTWSNKGKYPLLVGNSCFTGDIHGSSGESISEDFVLIRDRGVIGFIASVDLGLSSILREYSRSFYLNLGQEQYGLSVGEHMLKACRYLEGRGNSFANRSVAQLMTLHGDPALVINAHDRPDYSITVDGVKFDPNPVTTKSDTFQLQLDIFNFGKAVSDSLRIEVNRVYADMSSERYLMTLSPVMFQSQPVLELPVDPIKGVGFNRLDISLDPSNLISELDEGNNFVSLNFFVQSGDIIPVMPYDFAVIPDQSPLLKASTGYAFEDLQDYEFQLDTSGDFTFPIETRTISSRGGVVEWQPSSLSSMQEGRVYFWRARNKSLGDEAVWRSSSFKYESGKRGWSQDHFHQFRNNELTFLNRDENKRQFEFAPSVKKLSCQTSSTLRFSDLGNVFYKLDATVLEYGGCGLGSALHVAVLDSLTFEPWGTPYNGQNAGNDFGQLNKNGNCGKPRVQNFFIFRSNNAGELAGLKNMLSNAVPNGNYILAWTWVRNDFSNWDGIDPTLRDMFVNLGADSIDDISNDSLPYIFFVQKGNNSSAIEIIGKRYDEFIYLDVNIENSLTRGNILSPFIGPSSEWRELNWSHVSDPNRDSLLLTMKAWTLNFQNKMAERRYEKDETSNSLTGIVNAKSAPYMNLDIFKSDRIDQTAPQMTDWTVYYEGVTELALNAVDQYDFHADTLQEGEMLRFSVSVKNISDYSSDSVLVKFYVLDRNRKRVDVAFPRQKPLQPDSSFVAQVEISTLGLKGNNTLYIDVNPDFDQPEQHRFNNVGQIPFFVSGDNTDPILDVTFDGVHILDGDIISAKPEIVAQLTDDNEFLVLDDTSDFNLYLTDPSGTERRKFFQQSSGLYNLEFIPATRSKNKAKVIYTPELTEDGKYSMRIAAKDRSNNESGEQDYQISFEVINKSTITNLMNYPNPFSTSTKFVFVLTGSRIPDNMQIEIMTVTGKVVKYIYQNELGPIRIGRNVTQYSWDGRDRYGDKLANGVYLYRVNTRLDGQEIEHRETSADKYFKQGFGKMVILR